MRELQRQIPRDGGVAGQLRLACGIPSMFSVGVAGFKVLPQASFHHPTVPNPSTHPSIHWAYAEHQQCDVCLPEALGGGGRRGPNPLRSQGSLLGGGDTELARGKKRGTGKRSKRNTMCKDPEEGKTCKLISLLQQPKSMQCSFPYCEETEALTEKSTNIC